MPDSIGGLSRQEVINEILSGSIHGALRASPAVDAAMAQQNGADDAARDDGANMCVQHVLQGGPL